MVRIFGGEGDPGVMNWIEPYRVEGMNLLFTGAWKAESRDGSRVLLLSRNGHILLLDASLCRTLERQTPSEDLCFKLVQRGFMHLADDQGTFDQYADEFGVRPEFFMVDFTNRCNMACRYCLRECDREKSEEKVISREMLGQIAEFLEKYTKEHGLEHISIQPWGGEPLLEREKIFFLQDECRRRGIQADFTIESNGLLLTEELVEKLQNRGIHISVSMDGGRKVHDMQRTLLSGGPSHTYVEAAVRRLQERMGDGTAVLATVTRESARQVEGILDYFARELKVHYVKMNFVHQSSFVDNEGLCLSPEEIRDASLRILEKILSLQEEGIEIYDYNIHTKLRNLLLNEKSDVCLCRGCNGGRKMVTIDSRGDIYPCDITDYPEEKIGNIRDGVDLIEMVEKAMGGTPYFVPKTASKCGDCPWHYYCRGGCTVHVKTSGGTPGTVDEIECAVNRALYPAFVDLILNRPEKANRLAGEGILDY